MIDRRRFYRVVYFAQAQLTQGERRWATRLLDLSLQGALVERPADWPVQASGTFQLSFVLGGTDIEIHMDVTATNVSAQRLGLQCLQIDIDSASHLKRLIELNVGSSELLSRELAHLMEDHAQHS